MTFRTGKAALQLVFVFLLSVSAAWAEVAPPCMAQGQKVPVINNQVLAWKASTPNRFIRRARVQGVVQRVYADATGHSHFQIQIGRSPSETLEVIYNENFGELPNITPGMKVDACGDYITANQQYQKLPPSPDGAIIHWVHASPNPQRHDHGYLWIDGKVYGNDFRRANENPPRRNSDGISSKTPDNR